MKNFYACVKDRLWSYLYSSIEPFHILALLLDFLRDCSETYRTVLDLSHLEKGMYLLEMTGRDNVIREKFILQ